MAEHIARAAGRGPKTLFATHYHELTDLAADMPGVGNLHVSAREWQDGVVFLRKIEPGGSDRSFGIQVARLAGPARHRGGARAGDPAQPGADGVRPRGPPAPGAIGGARTRPAGRQLALFSGQDEAALDDLRRADINGMTPVEALAFLAEIKKRWIVVPRREVRRGSRAPREHSGVAFETTADVNIDGTEDR